MAFITSSSSSFCSRRAVTLASCLLRRRAKSIISSSVISDNDRGRPTETLLYISKAVTAASVKFSTHIQWDNEQHHQTKKPMLCRTLATFHDIPYLWVWVCVPSLACFFLLLIRTTEVRMRAPPARTNKVSLLLFVKVYRGLTFH